MSQQLRDAIQAAEPNHLVQIIEDFIEVQLKVGPYMLDRQALQTGIGVFNSTRGLVMSALPLEVTRTETTTLQFYNGGRIIELETLNAIAELTAPSLLLLLGQQDGVPIRIDIAGDVLRLFIPSPLRADLQDRLVLILVALLSSFIRDEPQRRLPQSLLWHPRLSEVSDRGQRITIAQQHADGTSVLSQGLMTTLWAETREGIAKKVTAHRSLTELFLYLENERYLLVGDEALNLMQWAGIENAPLSSNESYDIDNCSTHSGVIIRTKSHLG